MKSITQTMLEEIYEKADIIAKKFHQENTNNRYGYWITLEELEAILKQYQD